MIAGRGRTAPALVVGAGLAVLYVLVALATAYVSDRPLLPLFDGFVTPVAYNWVNPPPGFPDNKKPAEAAQDVALAGGGSVTANASTSDGQAIVGLDAGSVPAHAPDTAVHVHIVPIDPGTLGPLPAGLRPESNAYQVTLADVPSGAAVMSLPKSGTIALTAAAPTSSMLYSVDGRSWTEVKTQPFGDSNGLFAPLDAPGYYLSVSRNAPRSSAKSGGGSAPVIVGAIVVVLVGLVAGVAVVSRRRRDRPRGKGGRSER